MRESNSTYYLQGVDSEIGKGHDFRIFCNYKIFIIAVHPTSYQDDQIAPMLARCNSAISRNDDARRKKSKAKLRI
jgi:hypothetical protein